MQSSTEARTMGAPTAWVVADTAMPYCPPIQALRFGSFLLMHSAEAGTWERLSMVDTARPLMTSLLDTTALTEERTSAGTSSVSGDEDSGGRGHNALQISAIVPNIMRKMASTRPTRLAGEMSP